MYYRSYMKIQDVLNNINSNLSFLFLVFKLLCFSFNKFKLKQIFVEETMLFKYDADVDLFNNNRNLIQNDYCINKENKVIKEDSKKEISKKIDKIITKKLTLQDV